LIKLQITKHALIFKQQFFYLCNATLMLLKENYERLKKIFKKYSTKNLHCKKNHSTFATQNKRYATHDVTTYRIKKLF